MKKLTNFGNQPVAAKISSTMSITPPSKFLRTFVPGKKTNYITNYPAKAPSLLMLQSFLFPN
jgi:hypothetical protein